MNRKVLGVVVLASLLAACNSNPKIWNTNGAGEGEKKVWDNPDATRTVPKSIWTNSEGQKKM